MALTSKAVGRAAVDYVHDLVPGFFPGAVFAVLLVMRALDEADTGSGFAVSSAVGPLWVVLGVALSVSVVTGLLRVRYWSVPVRKDAITAKVQMIALKHVAFVLTQVAAGVVLATVVR